MEGQIEEYVGLIQSFMQSLRQFPCKLMTFILSMAPSSMSGRSAEF